MSSHYFIGKRLNPYESKKLETTLSYVLRRNSFLDKKDSTRDFMTSFIYLGYLEDKVAYDLLNLLDPYILALAQKTAPAKCVYKQFELMGDKTTHKNFSISYESENRIVHNTIMPYLQFALEEILEEQHKEQLGFEPNVNLVKIKTKLLSQFRNNNKIIIKDGDEVLPNYFVGKPQNKNKEQFFMFDSIDVIKGKPEELKVGTQSKTDRLILDTIRSVPLTGARNNSSVVPPVSNNQENNNSNANSVSSTNAVNGNNRNLNNSGNSGNKPNNGVNTNNGNKPNNGVNTNSGNKTNNGVNSNNGNRTNKKKNNSNLEDLLGDL